MMCTTKVSEWVLINNVPEKYSLVYYYAKPVDDQVKLSNKAVSEELKSSNLVFSEVRNQDIESPFYALCYRQRLIRKFENVSQLRNLSVSPLREKIAEDIMDGKLCAMLYLRSGNQVKDDKGREIIMNAIASSPFSNIITYYELDRNSAEEGHFVSMLLNVEDDLAAIEEPMLFGVFGRFRALEPLLARGISEENVGLMIDFLTADCSCLIKDNLPGADILFTNSWENPVPALVNKILDENPSLLHI